MANLSADIHLNQRFVLYRPESATRKHSRHCLDKEEASTIDGIEHACLVSLIAFNKTASLIFCQARAYFQCVEHHD